MNFNYQKARELMVENQLRPNKINDLNILNLFKTVPKEKFLPSSITKISYSDVDIKMLSNRGYLKNLHLAQLIKSAEIKIDDTEYSYSDLERNKSMGDISKKFYTLNLKK